MGAFGGLREMLARQLAESGAEPKGPRCAAPLESWEMAVSGRGSESWSGLIRAR